MKKIGVVFALLWSLAVIGQKQKDSVVVGKTIEETLKIAKENLANKKYKSAKANIEQYFKLHPDKSSEDYKVMLVNLTKVNKELKGKKPDEVAHFAIIEEVPVYPGCEGQTTNNQKKYCFSRKIQRHIGKNFDADLANKLGLADGRYRILMNFKINKEGEITDIEIKKAPHVKLEEEAVRILQLLPKMTPGMQRGKAISVKYALPLQFIVEGPPKEKKKRRRNRRN